MKKVRIENIFCVKCIELGYVNSSGKFFFFFNNRGTALDELGLNPIFLYESFDILLILLSLGVEKHIS